MVKYYFVKVITDKVDLEKQLLKRISTCDTSVDKVEVLSDICT